METKEDTEMNNGWGRVLIGIGVIVALLTLGALEVLTARLPTGEILGGQASSDHGASGPWQDFLDMRAQVAGHDFEETSVNERSETERAVAVAAQGEGGWLPQ